MGRHVLMAHSNVATIDSGMLTIDRKFLVGMSTYASRISAPLITIHPVNTGVQVMDPVTIPLKELPYSIEAIQVDRSFNPLPNEARRLSEMVASATLVYGDSMGVASLARQSGIPYIPILEYDLPTQITVATANVNSPIRRAVRIARTVWRHRKNIDHLRHAHSLHCNGYPIYDETRKHNPNSLLYLDSRMCADMVVTQDQLESKLAHRGAVLRLLFSGRYEPMKGALDAVEVAVDCLRRHFNVEMHCYGQGSLKAEMEHLASQSRGRIEIHDAVTYEELLDKARGFDVFVCCHVQNDPSCTYLEAFGAGLPIVGYGNRMWQRLCEQSGAGLVSPMGDPGQVADNIGRLIAEPNLLNELSRKAADFAGTYCFENEFSKRIDAINAAISH